jgi:predicted AAA+ superfamily ATPase
MPYKCIMYEVMDMYVDRSLTHCLESASKQFPVILVTGPRQVGKTTCLQHSAAKGRTYVTLDDPQIRMLAKEEPELFLQRFPAPVLIDEIQYAPELLPLIKIAVDTSKRCGDYWLTGSQQFHSMKDVTESLAGRVGILQLLGFSSRESQGCADALIPFSSEWDDRRPQFSVGLMDLYDRIWRGSYPALTLNPEHDRDLFFSSYLQTYLYRDVKALTNVGDEIAFHKFLRSTAARTGQCLNIADIARDAGIAPNTAKSWLSILKASGIIYLLEPYHNNLAKRMVKMPKLYFLDTGLAAYLTQWSTTQTLEAGAMSGAIFETWVVDEIIKGYWHAGKEAPIFYYRDKEKREIDLLIVQNGSVRPIEIKKTGNPSRNDCRHFHLLDKLGMPTSRGAVVCMTKTHMPITESVDAIPASWI